MATRTARTIVRIAPDERRGIEAASFAMESFASLALKTPGGARMVGNPRFVGYGIPPEGEADDGSRFAVYEADFEVGR